MATKAKIVLLYWSLISCLDVVFSQWDDYDPFMTLQDEQELLQYHMKRMQLGRNPGLYGEAPVMMKQPPRYKDFIKVENPPKKAENNYTLNVKYQCKKPSAFVLYMEGNHLRIGNEKLNHSISLFTDPDVIFFRKHWQCSPSPYEGKVSMQLVFPQEMLLRPNIMYQKVWTMQDVRLKIATVDKDMWEYLLKADNALRDIYAIAFDRSERTVQLPIKVEHPYCRSEKSFERCFTWPVQLLNSVFLSTPPKSPPDDMMLSLLPHPVYSSPSTTGVPRNFIGYKNPETRQISGAKNPRMTVSITMYAAFKCESLCAIFQHIDDDQKFNSPVIFLNNKDQVHVQEKLSNNDSYVITSDWKIPLREWIRLDLQLFGSLVNITIRFGENFTQAKSTVRSFMAPVELEYKDGYFTAGASLYSRGFHGIIGDMRLWRNMVLTSDQINPLPSDDPIFSSGIGGFLTDTDETQGMVKRRWEYLLSQNPDQASGPNIDICIPYFLEIIQPPNKETENQTPAASRALPRRYRYIESQLLKMSKKRKRKKDFDLFEVVGKRLYKRALKLMGDPDRLDDMAEVISVLENASLLMHGPSLFLLYVIHENGFGVDVNREKALTYIRLGAMIGDRMCVKTMAYKHFVGQDGFEEDNEVSYWYFVNAASRAQTDRQNHEEQMTEVNRVRLTDEKLMKSQTAEDDHLFEWLKHQANTGVKEAKRSLAQFLYWGKQGLKRNLKTAFEYYEKAAAEHADDPDALYDYGITLMKGHGTEVNEEKALEALEQAAAKESPSAYNTLGWYYIKQDGMKEKAVEYFEKASELNNIDATYNLGHMHFIGDYPGMERDLPKAFQYFYKAAVRGHVHSCTRVSYMYATGVRNFLRRNIKSAILWARPVAEMSPVMGELLREAIQAYRSELWAKSTLLYLAVAESGFEPAVFNTAFLCDDGQDKEIRHKIKKDCVWRFWNESAHHHFQTPSYAMNKMGDFHYYGIDGDPDMQKAISYYVEAAKKNEAQALFNLAFILEQHGDIIENETLLSLKLPAKALDRREDTILELYQKCSNLNTEANSMPCYIGYLRMKFIVLWKYTPLTSKLAATLVAVGISTLLIFASSLLRHTRQTDALVLTEQGSVEDPFSDVKTHILHEEIIEHELKRERSLTDSEKSINVVDNGIGLPLGEFVRSNGFASADPFELTSGKDLLEVSEDSSQDEEEVEEAEELTIEKDLSTTIFVPPSEIASHTEDCDNDECKKSV